MFQYQIQVGMVIYQVILKRQYKCQMTRRIEEGSASTPILKWLEWDQKETTHSFGMSPGQYQSFVPNPVPKSFATLLYNLFQEAFQMKWTALKLTRLICTTGKCEFTNKKIAAPLAERCKPESYMGRTASMCNCIYVPEHFNPSKTRIEGCTPSQIAPLFPILGYGN